MNKIYDLEDECALTNESMELWLKSLRAYSNNPDNLEILSVVNYNTYEGFVELSKYDEGTYVDDLIPKLVEVLKLLKSIRDSARSDIVKDCIVVIEEILKSKGKDYSNLSLCTDSDVSTTEGKKELIRNSYAEAKDKLVKDFIREELTPKFDKFDVIAQSLARALS